MFKTLRDAFKIPDLRKKIIYTILMVVVIRLGTTITVPGLNPQVIKQWFENQQGDAFSLFDAITGGSYTQMSLFAMGIMPYITASIIINLLTIAIPKLEEMQKEGEEGRKKISKYTRYLTVVLSAVQATATVIGFRSSGLFYDYNALNLIVAVVAITAGTSFLMWVGERITENGIGNGISLIIFINILSRLPADIGNVYRQILSGREFIQIILLLAVVLAVALAIITFVVLLQVAERRIPVQYAKKMQGRKMVGGQSTHIPLKVNTAGVIPVIFASSLLQFPSIIDQFIPGEPKGIWAEVLRYLNYYHVSARYFTGPILYGLLIVFFAYFYTSITFNPIEVANNMKNNGGFVPGIRPGKPTTEYLTKVVNKIVLIGAIGLTIVAIMPIIIQAVFKLNVSFSGTSLIIVVGVALETVKAIEAQMLMRHYKGFLNA